MLFFKSQTVFLPSVTAPKEPVSECVFWDIRYLWRYELFTGNCLRKSRFLTEKCRLFFFFSCQRQEPTSGWLENTVSLWPGSQKCHFPHLSALLLWVNSVSAGSLQSGPPWPTSSQISNPKGQRVAFPNILANILKLSLARRGLLAHLWSTLWCQGMEYAADSLDLMLSLGSVGVEASVIPDPQTLSGSYLKHAFSARVISPPRN